MTSTFLDTIRAGGYQRYTLVSVWYDGNFITDLPIAQGQIQIDRTADIRRSITLTVADEAFVPTFVNSPLAPYGAELVVEAGIIYQNGQIESCAMGVFRIESVAWDEAQGSLPVVTGYDRAKALQDNRLLFPIDYAGWRAKTLISRQIRLVMNVDVAIDLTLLDYRLPGGSVWEDDRLAAILNAASAMGGEGYFDVHGIFVIVPVPGLTQSDIDTAVPVWDVDAGPTGVLVSAQRGVSRTDVANAVAVTGAQSSNGEPPIGFAGDFDSRSPTYWGPETSMPYGPYAITPFGGAVKLISNPSLTTNKQCKVAAQAALRNNLGLARSLDFENVWNPALDAGDIVRVTYLDGTSELHLIDKLTIPIGTDGGGQTASTRTLTYQSTAHT